MPGAVMFHNFAMVRKFFVDELNNPISRYSRSYLQSMIGAVDILIADYYNRQEEEEKHHA